MSANSSNATVNSIDVMPIGNIDGDSYFLYNLSSIHDGSLFELHPSYGIAVLDFGSTRSSNVRFELSHGGSLCIYQFEYLKSYGEKILHTTKVFDWDESQENRVLLRCEDKILNLLECSANQLDGVNLSDTGLYELECMLIYDEHI